MNSNNWKSVEVINMLRAFLTCRNEKEIMNFARDLLTENELIEFGRRFAVARMLSENQSYENIENQTAMSSTTIARIAKFLSGKYGGYRMAITRLYSKSNKSLKLTPSHTRPA